MLGKRAASVATSSSSSQKFGFHIHLLDVEERSLILIHAGNYYTQTEGCILVGFGMRDINGDNRYDTTDSRRFLNEMLYILPDEFNILIIDEKPVHLH